MAKNYNARGARPLDLQQTAEVSPLTHDLATLIQDEVGAKPSLYNHLLAVQDVAADYLASLNMPADRLITDPALLPDYLPDTTHQPVEELVASPEELKDEELEALFFLNAVMYRTSAFLFPLKAERLKMKGLVATVKARKALQASIPGYKGTMELESPEHVYRRLLGAYAAAEVVTLDGFANRLPKRIRHEAALPHIGMWSILAEPMVVDALNDRGFNVRPSTPKEDVHEAADAIIGQSEAIGAQPIALPLQIKTTGAFRHGIQFKPKSSPPEVVIARPAQVRRLSLSKKESSTLAQGLLKYMRDRPEDSSGRRLQGRGASRRARGINTEGY